MESSTGWSLLAESWGSMSPKAWELWGVQPAGHNQGEEAAAALQETSVTLVLNTKERAGSAGGCCFLLYQPQVSWSWCWVAANTSVQSLLFCKPFLAHKVMVLSVKKLLSPVYPYPALPASLSSASIPSFHIYCYCLPTFLAIFPYQLFCAWKIP